MKRRKAKYSKPTDESATTIHDNLMYDSQFQPEKNAEDNTYEQNPSACGKDQEDMPEQFFKPTGESARTSHSNPTYGFCDFQPENNAEDNIYEPSPSACGKGQEDLPEQFYDNIGYATGKDLADEFADDDIYENLEPFEKGGYELSFINQSYT